MNKKYTLRDGAVIIEKKEKVNGIQTYGYYYGKEYTFGVEKPFRQADLQTLYDNGYFDLWRLKDA